MKSTKEKVVQVRARQVYQSFESAGELHRYDLEGGEQDLSGNR